MESGKSHYINWVYVIPALIMMAFVSAIPIGQCLWMGEGYSRLAGDAKLGSTLYNSLFFTGTTVIIELVLGLVMAVVLMKNFPGRGLARACVLIPWALPTAVMAMSWQWIFNDTYGVLGDVLYKLHLVSDSHIPWLATPGLAMAACILADVWKTTPFVAIILMSGLANIPDDLYEAVSIDGAGAWKQFWIITLPLLRPTIALAVLFRVIQSFGIFDLVWVLTGGGPGGSTQMIALYAYDTVFRYLDLPYGAALTLVMVGCLLCMSAVIFLVLFRKPVEE